LPLSTIPEGQTSTSIRQLKAINLKQEYFLSLLLDMRQVPPSLQEKAYDVLKKMSTPLPACFISPRLTIGIIQA
jgi:hypothetical protein